jgi:4-hydroxythreonine-4-phosphate dehydrogenase
MITEPSEQMTIPPAKPISSPSPSLALTIGDPAGIGPEVTLRALVDGSEGITVFGDRPSLHQTYRQIEQTQGTDYVQQHLADPDSLTVIEVEQNFGEWHLGSPSAQTGAASFAYLENAIAQTLAGHYSGIVTGPIAKSAWKAAGHLYPGQTELLAQKADVDRFGMMFVATSPTTQWQLRALLATTHIPLAQVPQTLTPALMTLKLDLLIETLQELFGIETPRIAIAGLNPHSGELGQLGTEEQDWIGPWLKAMGDHHPQATLDGPIPPDTMWVRPGQAWFGQTPLQNHPPHDAYLALYHDQGLIPVKLMAFDRAVNTTIGLPFIRTSPDHGTAFDIAGKGLADATSMKAAIALAQSLGTRNCTH